VFFKENLSEFNYRKSLKLIQLPTSQINQNSLLMEYEQIRNLEINFLIAKYENKIFLHHKNQLFLFYEYFEVYFRNIIRFFKIINSNLLRFLRSLSDYGTNRLHVGLGH